jgi:hypothetical protein
MRKIGFTFLCMTKENVTKEKTPTSKPSVSLFRSNLIYWLMVMLMLHPNPPLRIDSRG